MLTQLHSRRIAAIIGALSLAPPLMLARLPPGRSLALAAGSLLAVAVLRGGARLLAPDLARGYVLSRLCSPRYALPAAGVPVLGGALIASFGAPALAVVLLAQLLLAQHYRACWSRPGALAFACLPALLGGVHCALECLALRGAERGRRDRLLYAEQNARQRLTLLDRQGALELLIDGELQFCSSDERLYHEGLLAPAQALVPPRAHVLILGGGDGLAARDLLRAGNVERIAIVDWDRSVTRLFRSEPQLRALNGDALRDSRVTIVHRDVRELIAEPGGGFDLIVGDLTDPNPNDGSAAQCTGAFYRALAAQLNRGGAIVSHTSSSDGSAMATIPAALQEAGLHTHSYALAIPSFQRVTYVLATQEEIALDTLPTWARAMTRPE